MSIFSKDFMQRVKPDTKESIIKQLLDATDYETKTEIRNVLAMSVLDILGYHFNNPLKKLGEIEQPNFEDQLTTMNVGDFLMLLGKRYRINAISKDRASRREATEALKGVESEEGSTNAFRKLLGMG